MSYKPWNPPVRGSGMDAERMELQSLLDRSVNEFRLSGLQAGILRPGKSAVTASAGTEDFSRRKPEITGHSSFRVGSATKMFVSALICRFAEQGLLGLDDPVSLWFPAYPRANLIRVRDLLNQTSGIRESLFSDPGILVPSLLFSRMRWDPEAVITRIAKKAAGSAGEAGSFTYANDNYILLGLIAEKAGGDDLARLLEKEFFIPLGMQDSGFLPASGPSRVKPVSGYDEYIPFGPHLIASDQTSWDSLAFAAGGLYSSAGDLLTFMDALFHGRVVGGGSLKAMRTWVDSRNNGRDESMTGYGLGLARYEVAGRILEGHPGGGFGGECFPFYDSETDTSYVVAYNLSRKDNPAGKEILRRMMGR